MVIKSFKLFESHQSQLNSDIDAICKKYKIEKYSVNPDGSIDVDDDVNLHSMNLTKLPLKFRHVNGYFTCGNNQITSLEGCPTSVGGDFYCSDNQLTSLKGCPQTIGEDFYCNNNQLTSLEGCPESIGRDFNCSYNQLTSLEGCPESIGGYFICSYNQLTSLKGCPTSVGENFHCYGNQIKDFGNKYFKFQDFDCINNPIFEIYNLNPCKEFIEYLIEYQVIRDGNKIIRIRLEKALEDSNGELRDVYRFKNYELI